MIKKSHPQFPMTHKCDNCNLLTYLNIRDTDAVSQTTANQTALHAHLFTSYDPGEKPYCGGSVNVTLDLALRKVIDLVSAHPLSVCLSVCVSVPLDRPYSTRMIPGISNVLFVECLRYAANKANLNFKPTK